MYGSVVRKDLVQAFKAAGHQVTITQILDDGLPVKKTGDYSAKIRLHPNVMGSVSFNVVSSNPAVDDPNQRLDDLNDIPEIESDLSQELKLGMGGAPALIISPCDPGENSWALPLQNLIGKSVVAKAITKVMAEFANAGEISTAPKIELYQIGGMDGFFETSGLHYVSVDINPAFSPVDVMVIISPSLKTAQQELERDLSARQLGLVSRAALYYPDHSL